MAYIFPRILCIILLASALLCAEQQKPVDVSAYNGQIRLACVGDSITAGVGADKGMSWPDQIQSLLGEKWQARGFGMSGATLMNSADRPYQATAVFKGAITFNPHIVVIMLGTNDTKDANWAHQEDFIKDYKDLIAKFAALETKPRIFLCHPPYWKKRESRITAEIPMIEAVAKETRAGIIDVHAATLGRDELFPDHLHPNNEGAKLIAEVVANALVGKAPVKRK